MSRKIKLASVLRSPVCYLLQVGLQEDVDCPSSPCKYALGLSNLLHGFVVFPLSLYYLSCWICWSDGHTSKEFLDHGSHAYGAWKGWRWRWGEMVPSLPSQSFLFSMQYQKFPPAFPCPQDLLFNSGFLKWLLKIVLSVPTHFLVYHRQSTDSSFLSR